MKEANMIICVCWVHHTCAHLPCVKRLEETLLMTDLWFVVSTNLLLSGLVV